MTNLTYYLYLFFYKLLFLSYLLFQQAQINIVGRKSAELANAVPNKRNENIKQTGQLVVDLIDATAASQLNLSNYFLQLTEQTEDSNFRFFFFYTQIYI